MKATRCKVMIVDDHPMMRDGISGVICQQPDMEVCGLAGNCQEAMRLAEKKLPDVVLIDLSLGNSSGLNLIRDLKKSRPQLTLLVLSMYDESSYAVRSIQAGAQGYIMKTDGPDQLLRAIRQALQGELVVSNEVRRQISDRVLKGKSSTNAEPMESLSNRELEVFNWLGKGCTTRVISEKMHVSIKTIETYRERIKQKLGIASAVELLHCAVKWSEKRTP